MASRRQDVRNLGERKATVPRYVTKPKIFFPLYLWKRNKKSEKLRNPASFAERSRMRTHSGGNIPASRTNTCSNPVPDGFMHL